MNHDTTHTNNNHYDTIVIGAGPNGLTAAALLAKSGRKTLLLERRPILGGLAASEEFHPGFTAPGPLHDATTITPEIVKDLNLTAHGLRLTDTPPPTFIPQTEGPGLLLHRDPKKSAAELTQFAPSEAEAYANYRAFLTRITPIIQTFLAEPPPKINPEGLAEIWPLLTKGIAVRRLGTRTMSELLRLPPMCVADWLNEWFKDERLKCILAIPALLGSFAAPWTPGTCALLLRHEAMQGSYAPDGPLALIAALASAAEKYGVTIKTSAEVANINVENDTATGVTLSDGETIGADRILATCDPKTTFLNIILPDRLSNALDRGIRAYRSSGVVAKVNLAIKGRLTFASRPDLVVEHAVIAESIDQMERAFDAAKYRRCSDNPILDIRVSSPDDRTAAPTGCSVVSILVQYAPRDLDAGWTSDSSAALGDNVVSRLATCAPDIESQIQAREVLTPADIESRHHCTGGHIHHGEHALDQLIVRPTPQAARYATPIANLFLGSSGTHPGGGITCLPGKLAVNQIMTEERR